MTHPPLHRIAYAAIVGTAAGLVIAAYHNTWLATIVTGLLTGLACTLYVLGKLAWEAHVRRVRWIGLQDRLGEPPRHKPRLSRLLADKPPWPDALADAEAKVDYTDDLFNYPTGGAA